MKRRPNRLSHFVELTTGLATASMGAAYLLEVQPVVLGGVHIVLGGILFIEGSILCLSCFPHEESGTDGSDGTSAGA